MPGKTMQPQVTFGYQIICPLDTVKHWDIEMMNCTSPSCITSCGRNNCPSLFDHQSLGFSAVMANNRSPVQKVRLRISLD